MSIETPYPELDEIVELMGKVGCRLNEMNACEGAAGNISVCMGWPVDPRRLFPLVEEITFPDAVPGLAGYSVIVTGSGRRLREVLEDPGGNLGFVTVNADGRGGKLYTSPRRLFKRVTSEFNSHLAVHEAQILASGSNFNAVIHGQPNHLTYLSNIPSYQDEKYFNQRILRWQPELIIQLPDGIGLVPFIVPGTPALMEANIKALKTHRLVLWGKHGVMARSDSDIKHACDLIEYAEAGARYEYMNLVNGEKAQGLSAEEIRVICKTFNIQQSIF